MAEEKAQIVIDLSAWKMKDKNTFMRLANESGKTGDESPVFPEVAKLVKAWPYRGDPADPAAYDELTVEEWQQVSEALQEAITAKFQSRK